VIAVFDVGEHEGLPFLVMELVEGPSLATLMDQRRSLPVDTTIRYVADICDALSHAHSRGVVHRDVKPSNVLVDNDRARLADFGIALDAQATQTAVAGSPNYFAPEQMKGTADHRADLFALGALLYELLTGWKAFPGSISDGVLYRIVHAPAPELPPDLAGTDLASVVARALEKEPEKRFQSAEEFKLALAQASPASAVSAAGALATVPAITSLPESEVVRFRRRLIESVAPAEVRRLKYEVDQYLSTRPYEVDARLLSDDIERALGLPESATMQRPAGATPASWRRVAAYASTFAVAVIAVSTFVMLRDTGPASPLVVADPPAATPVITPAAGGVEAPPDKQAQGISRPAARSSKTAVASGPPQSTSPDALTKPTATSAGTPAIQVTPVPLPPSPAVGPVPDQAAPMPAGARPAPITDRPPLAPVPTSPDVDARPVVTSVERLIADYEAAYARRDVEAVKALYPSVDVQGLTAAVQMYRVWRYSITIRSISYSGDEATVEADVNLSTETNTGVTASQPARATFRLRRTTVKAVGIIPFARWSIDRIELQPR
jgi:serine/threonine-protein kinase